MGPRSPVFVTACSLSDSDYSIFQQFEQLVGIVLAFLKEPSKVCLNLVFVLNMNKFIYMINNKTVIL